jgi:hypothetical protein
MPRRNVTQQEIPERKPWYRSLYAVLVATGTALAAIAGFSTNLLSVRDNVGKLFGREQLKITIREASATFGMGGSLHIVYIVSREGRPDLNPLCAAEASYGLQTDFFEMGLSRSSGIISGIGDQARVIDLIPRSLEVLNPYPEVLSFRLNCGLMVTPWMPLKITSNPIPSEKKN